MFSDFGWKLSEQSMGVTKVATMYSIIRHQIDINNIEMILTIFLAICIYYHVIQTAIKFLLKGYFQTLSFVERVTSICCGLRSS